MTFQKNLENDFKLVENILSEKREMTAAEFFQKLQQITNEEALPRTYFRNIKSLFFAKNIKHIKKLVNSGTHDLNYLLKIKIEDVDYDEIQGESLFKHNLNKPPEVLKMRSEYPKKFID